MTCCQKCEACEPDVRFYESQHVRKDGTRTIKQPCASCYPDQTRKQDAQAPLTGKLCPMCDTPCRGTAARIYCGTKCGMRAREIRVQYGLAPVEYRTMIEALGGRCPICLKRARKTWHVDHNHKTNLVTGIVCGTCNTGALAYTFHDVELVRRLLAYLDTPPASLLGLDREIPVGARKKQSNLNSTWSRGRPTLYGKSTS